MITHLKGTIEKLTENSIVMDVNGVGYNVLCSSRMFSETQSYGNKFFLIYTVLVVREDAWILYGFKTEQERLWFNTLISVQGVGGKAALAILSALSDDDIYNAFLCGDKNMFTRADGVGPKLAARIISELKDKVVGKVNLAATETIAQISENNVVNDVISALSNLGYQKSDIMREISTTQFEKDVAFDVLLRKILAKLSGDGV